MIFKRKPRNRRFDRRHVLDVKLSSRHRRQTRLRRLVVVSGIFLAIFAGLFAVWRGGEWMLARFVYENPAFAIHQLDVQTDGVVSLEQLRRWAGVRLEDNLLAIDLARVKRDLELVPVVESVSVERVLPHTLRIRVVEREPIAQFVFPRIQAAGVAGRGVYNFDAGGWVMTPLENHQLAAPMTQTNLDHLPVLIGIAPSELRLGGQVQSIQVRAALRLIEAFARSPMAGVVDLKQIDLTSPNILQVSTGQGCDLIFGLMDFEAQLRRWRAIYEYGQKTGRRVAWMDLSVSNNVPARWLEASLVPPATPKPTQPTHNRKRNV